MDGVLAVVVMSKGLSAKLITPSQVVEGDRYAVCIKVKRPSLLRRIYGYQKAEDVFMCAWSAVRKRLMRRMRRRDVGTGVHDPRTGP